MFLAVIRIRSYSDLFCQVPGPEFSSPVPDPDLTVKPYLYIISLNFLFSKILLKMELIFIRTSVSDLHSFDPDTANFSMRIRSRIQGANRMRVRADPDPGLLSIKFWCIEIFSSIFGSTGGDYLHAFVYEKT